MLARLNDFDDALDQELFDEVGKAVGDDDRAFQAALEGPLAGGLDDNGTVAGQPHPAARQAAADIGDDGPVRTGNEAQTVLGRQRLARERTGTLGVRLVGGVDTRVALSCVDTHTRSDRSFNMPGSRLRGGIGPGVGGFR